MKSKANKIITIFIILSIVFIFASFLLLEHNYTPTNFTIHLFLDLCFIIVIGLTVRYFILKNDAENLLIFEKIKNSNSEIQESKERYDIVAKATSDTIWDWKIKENQFSWNKGILGIYGYNKKDVGKNSQWWFDRIHPEDTIRMSVNLYSFLEQKSQKWQDEYRFKCNDGSYRYVLDRGFLVFDDFGNPTRMIGAMQDITKRKEEEQRLKLLETVITNTKDAVVITDVAISEFIIPKIVFVNKAYTKMSGFLFEDVVGKLPLLFNKENVYNEEIERFNFCLKNKLECEIEAINFKKNKEQYWVKFSMVPVFNLENEHTHWISIQRDVTERKKQEKEKEQLINELTQNNKDLRQFSYITSHNLRAPLSNLIGLLKLIEEISIEDEELKLIIDGFSKSTYLLNETILDLGKVVIIRDNPSIEKQQIQITDSLNKVLNQIDFLIKFSNPIININFDDSIFVFSNKAYFESILLNLFTNAIKYRSTDNKLEIEISTIENEDSTSIIFKDNGIGIDLEKYKEKIFGLYQRFHDYPDSKGLGLYLVKSQIESMGGEIDIKSQVNIGTEFIIKFKNQK